MHESRINFFFLVCFFIHHYNAVINYAKDGTILHLDVRKL